MISRILVLVVLVPTLAGCLGLAPSQSACGTVTVPRAQAGAVQLYDVEGREYTDVLGDPVVDWRAVNPDTNQDQGDLEPAPGSTLRVSVADRPEPRLTLVGDQRQAFHATYWMNDPREPAPLPFRDVWIDAETANIVEWSNRAGRTWPDGPDADEDRDVEHFSLFQRRSVPPLLLAPFFWDRPLLPGLSGNHTFPDGPFVPGQEDPQMEFFDWEVETVRRGDADGRCVAEVAMEVGLRSGSFLRVFEVEAVYADDVPLPVGWTFHFTDGGVGIDLDLTRHEPGSGPELPRFVDVRDRDGYRPTQLARRSPRDGFFADRGGVFATDYDEALAAIRDDEEAGAWLDAHPGARPMDVEHTVGHNSTDPGSVDWMIVDQWSITWADPNGSGGMGATAVKRKRVPLTNVTEIVVSSWLDDEAPDPVPVGDWLTLDGIVTAYRARWGQEPKIIGCSLDAGFCGVGTPATMRSSGTGHAGDITGTMFWFERGWVYGEAAVVPDPLGAPVR